MIQVTEIAFTGYPVSDVPRARAFYEGLLGLTPTMAHEMNAGVWWVEYDIGAATLALSNAWPPSGQSGPSVALEVADFPGAVAALEKAGVKFNHGPVETPVCWLGVISDPDGNGITIHKRKPGHA